MAHHVITGIERRGDAMRRSLNHADAETRDVARTTPTPVPTACPATGPGWYGLV